MKSFRFAHLSCTAASFAARRCLSATAARDSVVGSNEDVPDMPLAHHVRTSQALTKKKPRTPVSSSSFSAGQDEQQQPRSSKDLRNAADVQPPLSRRVVPSTSYATFTDVMPMSEFRAAFESKFAAGERHNGSGDSVDVKVAGRIVSIRDIGKLIFITLKGGGLSTKELLQVCVNVGPHYTTDQLDALKNELVVGDIVGVVGSAGRTKKGELSVFAQSIAVLAPYVCTDMTVIPDQRSSAAATSHQQQNPKPTESITDTTTVSKKASKKQNHRRSNTKLKQNTSNSSGSTSADHLASEQDSLESDSPAAPSSPPSSSASPRNTQLADVDLKYRYRFVDMITDPSTISTFRMRHVIIQSLRSYLNSKDFTEVETPVFHTVPCGANAKPFTTHHNCNDTSLFLRVAPELFLKQCVVGGMDRVYEIGKVFRNEDSDKSHNPEFTSCEFYAAYHSYEDLMPMTEEIVRTMAIAASGSPTMEVVSCVTGTPVTIDLTKPFKRVKVYNAIEAATGVKLPPPKELDTPRGIAFMAGIMLQHNIPLPTVRTGAKMFDKLIDFFITDHVVEPTFVCDHPLFMSPLAKESETAPGISERFELFVNGMEICNSYSELNDPQEQLRRFEQQMRDKEKGDDEAMSLDETFLKALQTGMPPTAGWGMGIDRVVMLLTKTKSIRDVVIFPLLRPDVTSHDAKRRRKTASFFGFNQQMTLFCLSALEAELQRRGELGMKTEHLKALRRTVLELSRRRTELEEQLEKCRESAAAGGCFTDGGQACGLWARLLHDILCGRGNQ